MDFENQNFVVFEVVVHNLGRCDNDMIKRKNNDFHYMHTYVYGVKPNFSKKS